MADVSWYGWVLVGALTVNALATVARIGEPREPITPTDAVTTLIRNGVWIAAVLALGGAL